MLNELNRNGALGLVAASRKNTTVGARGSNLNFQTGKKTENSVQFLSFVCGGVAGGWVNCARPSKAD